MPSKLWLIKTQIIGQSSSSLEKAHAFGTAKVAGEADGLVVSECRKKPTRLVARKLLGRLRAWPLAKAIKSLRVSQFESQRVRPTALSLEKEKTYGVRSSKVNGRGLPIFRWRKKNAARFVIRKS